MDINKLRPTGDQVLLCFDAHINAREDTYSPGGILLPRTAQPQAGDGNMATVMAVGPGYWNDKWPGGEVKNWHEHGSGPLANGAFIPLDASIVPGARVITTRAALAGDRIYDDERGEYRMCRADVIAAVVDE